MWGLDQINNFPFPSSQAFGLYALYAVYALWLGRGHLAAIVRAVVTGRGEPGDEQEPMSYRAAVVGAALGLAGLVWFSVAAGMRMWVAVALFVIYYLLAFAITRMRAQFGVPAHRLLPLEETGGAMGILTSVLGTRALPKGDLVGLANYYWFNRAYGAHPMPHQMEAMKMQDETGGTSKGLPAPLLLATLTGTVVCFWVVLHLYYSWGAGARGGASMWAPQNFTMLGGWLAAPEGPRWASIVAIVIGAAVGFFLQTMRTRFVNWPLHPLSFAVSGEYKANHIWLPLLLAWVTKSTVIRYGGHKIYLRLIPLFLGLMLGEFVMKALFDLATLALDLPRLTFK